MWGFDLAGGKSTRLFENIQDAASYLASYKLRQDVDTQVERVKFVKFDSGSDKLDDESYEHVVNKYQTKRKREVKRRMETEEKEYQAARDFVTPIIGRKPTRRAEVIKGLLDVNKTLADKMAAMEKQLAKLSKQINGGKKNVTKRHDSNDVRRGTKIRGVETSTKPAKKKVSGKVEERKMLRLNQPRKRYRAKLRGRKPGYPKLQPKVQRDRTKANRKG
jgi:chromosome segregation ATPase